MCPRRARRSTSPAIRSVKASAACDFGRSMSRSMRDVRASAVLSGARRMTVASDAVPPPQAAASSPKATPAAASLRIAVSLPEPSRACHPGSGVELVPMCGSIALPLLTSTGLLVLPSLRGVGTCAILALALSLGGLVLLAVHVPAGPSPQLAERIAGTEGWLRFIVAVHLAMERF